MNSSAKKIDTSLEFKEFNHSEDELKLTAKLLNQVWPDTSYLNYEYLKWQYLDNPVGLAYGFNAWLKNEIVGHYAAIPVSAEILGKKETGLLSLNTAVREDHRGQNLFKILASKTFEHAKKDGLSFVIGVANQNSTLLFKRQLKFQIVSPLDVLLGIGRITLLNKSANEPSFKFNFTDEFLKWRMQRPSSSYFKQGKYIFTDTHKFGIKAQMTSQFPQNINIKSSSKRRFINQVNPLNLYIGLGDYLKRGFFMKLPDRLKPSPLNLIFKDLTDDERTIDNSKSFIELIDFDAY